MSNPQRKPMFVTREEAAMILNYRAAKTCASKQAFETETAAKREAIQKMMRSRDKAPPLNVYLCPVCGKHHLSSRTKPSA
jgi:topoisomerase IA-like protein